MGICFQRGPKIVDPQFTRTIIVYMQPIVKLHPAIFPCTLTLEHASY